jgi:hypothetical protein
MFQRGTNIMANQVTAPINNYFEKVLYENLTFEISPLGFKSSRGIKKKSSQVPVVRLFTEDYLNLDAVLGVRWLDQSLNNGIGPQE